MSGPVIDAQHFWSSQNSLGEGILWDSDANVLRWVDIKRAEIHSLDPVTKGYTVDSYPETQNINAIALRKNKEDILGLTQHDVAILPLSTPNTSSPTSPKDVQKTAQKIKKVIASPMTDLTSEGIEMRWNDGGADPSGRFFGGSTGVAPPKGNERGEFFRVEADGSTTKIFDGITCSNGLGWSPDAKTMYYIDSGVDEIRAFDYDIETGTLSNKRIFATTPAPLEPSKQTQGVFDGMTMDGKGNLWVARWKDSRVIGFRPDGSVIANVRTPGCLMTTIPCFGGKNLDQMYIASANTQWAREGDIQPTWPYSGDIMVADFGPDSEIRKLLGDDWKGAERHRYAA